MPAKNPKGSPSKPVAKGPLHKKRLTEDMRVEILKRLKAGEKASALAKEFKVTRQAVSLLKIKAATAKSRPRLVEQEVQKLRKLATTTLPSDHGFEKPGSWYDQWNSRLLHKLAVKVARRPLMVLPVQRLYREWFPPINDGIRVYRTLDEFILTRGRAGATAKAASPAAKPTAGTIAKPPARKRARRGSLASLMPPPEAWEFLHAGGLAKPPGKKQSRRPAKPVPAPVARTGKHRKSKGAPFTAARNKKKKR